MSDTFGQRYLVDESQVFTHNAWDNVEWDPEKELEAIDIINTQKQHAVPQDQRQIYADNAARYWDIFYGNHATNFFKDRKWLSREFPEVFCRSSSSSSSSPSASLTFRILELGCGAGNSLFPILNWYRGVGRACSDTDDDSHNGSTGAEMPISNVMVYGCDFSQNAVDICRAHGDYDAEKALVFKYDITSPDIPPEIHQDSLDVILSIFVLSSVTPAQFRHCLGNLYRMLKPGGVLCFRDYGRYDTAQLRFKKNRLLEDNFYVRGDGTQVYFFETGEIEDAAREVGFEVEDMRVDRRLIVNRRLQLKMYRIWIQSRLRKPVVCDPKGQ